METAAAGRLCRTNEIEIGFQGESMSGKKIFALILLAAGLFILVQGGFSFTKKKESTKLGPLELSYSKKEHVSLPSWVGIVAIVGGVALLVVPGKK